MSPMAVGLWAKNGDERTGNTRFDRQPRRKGAGTLDPYETNLEIGSAHSLNQPCLLLVLLLLFLLLPSHVSDRYLL